MPSKTQPKTAPATAQPPTQPLTKLTAKQAPPTPAIDVRVGDIQLEKNPLAFASVSIGECFAVRGIRVMDGSRGVFVSMPATKGADNEYKDVCFPITKDFHDKLYGAVLKAFELKCQEQGIEPPAPSQPQQQAAPEMSQQM